MVHCSSNAFVSEKSHNIIGEFGSDQMAKIREEEQFRATASQLAPNPVNVKDIEQSENSAFVRMGEKVKIYLFFAEIE